MLNEELHDMSIVLERCLMQGNSSILILGCWVCALLDEETCDPHDHS